jgi:hypothetical protein
MEIWLRMLQRYLQPNPQDMHRQGCASADIGAGLVGGHTQTSGAVQLKTIIKRDAERTGAGAVVPHIDRPGKGEALFDKKAARRNEQRPN